MDYGHTGTSRLDQPNDDLFLHGLTAGSGSADPNLNANNPAENLDTTNEIDWNQPLEHDKRAIGNTAINPVELSMPPSTLEQGSRPPMGEITDFSLRPEAAPRPYQDTEPLPQSQEISAKEVKKDLTPEIESIKITEQLNEAGVKNIEQEIQDFESGKISPAEFYAEHRYEKIPAALQQSYGEQSNWKGKKAA